MKAKVKVKVRSPVSQEAGLIIGGLKHTAAFSCLEDMRRNQPAWFARTRGYRFMDDFARNLGLAEQRHGQSVEDLFVLARARRSGVA